MKAVIHAKFSSEKQNEASIESQLRECLEYAQFNGIEVIGNYIDRAQTAFWTIWRSASAKCNHSKAMRRLRPKDNLKKYNLVHAIVDWYRAYFVNDEETA